MVEECTDTWWKKKTKCRLRCVMKKGSLDDKMHKTKRDKNPTKGAVKWWWKRIEVDDNISEDIIKRVVGNLDK